MESADLKRISDCDVDVVDYERILGYAAGRWIPVRDALHEIVTWPHWGWPHGWPGNFEGRASTLKPPSSDDGQPAEAIYDEDLERVRQFALETGGLSFARAFKLLTRRPFTGPVEVVPPTEEEMERKEGDNFEEAADSNDERDSLMLALVDGEYDHLTMAEVEALWKGAYVLLPHERRH